MIIISRKAIELTLAQTVIAHRSGAMQEFQASIEERLRGKLALFDYIESGLITLDRITNREKLVRAGYESGAQMTFRMIEEQLSLDNRSSPDITREDVEKANDVVDRIIEMEPTSVSLAEIDRIRAQNREFGDYVFGYAASPVTPKLVARGFSYGVATTYSVYEAAFERLAMATKKQHKT